MKMLQNVYICRYKISSSGDVQSKKYKASWPIKNGYIYRVPTPSRHPEEDATPGSTKPLP